MESTFKNVRGLVGPSGLSIPEDQKPSPQTNKQTARISLLSVFKGSHVSNSPTGDWIPLMIKMSCFKTF